MSVQGVPGNAISIGIQTSRTNTPLPPITNQTGNTTSIGETVYIGNTTCIGNTTIHNDNTEELPTSNNNTGNVANLPLNTAGSSNCVVLPTVTTPASISTSESSVKSGDKTKTYISKKSTGSSFRVVTIPVSRGHSPEKEEDDTELSLSDKQLITEEYKYREITSDLGVKDNAAEMSAKGVQGGTVPIIRVKQDAVVVNRGSRKFHGIAELNAMRNKHVSFDQFRLAKRKGLREKDHFRIANRLSFGETNESSDRPLSIWGKGPNSDFTNYSLKSSDTMARLSPQLALARSKTYSGPLSKGSRTPQNNKDVLEDEKDDMSVCEIKGSSLQREISTSLSLNHNTPQPDDDTNDKAKLLAKYMEGMSPTDGDKLQQHLSLSVDQSNGTNAGIKSIPKRFKPKRDNSKIVLKYYADGMSRKRVNGLHISENTNNMHGIVSPSKFVTTDNGQNDKKLSFKQESGLAVASSVTISNGYLDNLTSTGPVSLTTRNLELFEKMSSVNNKTQSSLIMAQDEQAINDRVTGWIKDRQKALESSNTGDDTSSHEHDKDLKGNQLFPANTYKHPVPVYQY